MKRVVYIILWVLLGLILSFILHAAIELLYLKYTDPSDLQWVSVSSGSCALPLWLVYLLPFLGVIFGIWAGFFCWRILYIEHRGRKWRK